MNEQQKTFLTEHWQKLVIAFLIVVLIIVYKQWDQTKKDWETERNTLSAQKTKDEINKPSKEVEQREKEIYPKIDKDINDLNRNVKLLNEKLKQAEKNKPTKEQSYAIFKNQSTSEINRYFNSIGIHTTIESSISN